LGSPSSVNPQATAAEPISAGSGDYYYQRTDIGVAGRTPLSFQRTYNSQDNYSGAIGANWTHSYNITIGAGAVPNGAVVKYGDGHGENYTLRNGVYFPAPGVTSTLTQSAGTQGFLGTVLGYGTQGEGVCGNQTSNEGAPPTK
jgi:hypothetical protein